jgi:hypothetical protein
LALDKEEKTGCQGLGQVRAKIGFVEGLGDIPPLQTVLRQVKQLQVTIDDSSYPFAFSFFEPLGPKSFLKKGRSEELPFYYRQI